MTYVNYLTTLFLTILLCLACNKKTTDISDKDNKTEKTTTDSETGNPDDFVKITGTWKVLSYPINEKIYPPKTPYSVNFDNGNLGLSLEINSCGTAYKQDKTHLNFDNAMSCTEACCDSKEGQALSALFSGKAKYTLNANSLTIHSKSGDIKLSKATGGIRGIEWLAKSYASVKEGAHIKFSKTYKVFFEDKSIRVVLDANTCNTTIAYNDKTATLELPNDGMGCSRKCCDSEDGVLLVNMLKGKVSYKYDAAQGTLTLKTSNNVILFTSSSQKD